MGRTRRVRKKAWDPRKTDEENILNVLARKDAREENLRDFLARKSVQAAVDEQVAKAPLYSALSLYRTGLKSY